MTAALSVHGLSVRYDARTVLRDVTIGFAPASVIGLVGPNGAGKSTLLRACAGLASPSAGEIRLEGKPLSAWNRRHRARALGYLAQDRSVLWPLAAERLVALGRLPHLGPWDTISAADAAAVHEAMAATDVLHLAQRAVTALSGGEVTRVLVARLLAGGPSVLLADEPVSGLDPAHAMQVLEIFRARARQGRTVVVVLHDLTLAARFCDRLVLLNGGCIAAAGAPAEVLTPKNLAQCYGITADILTCEGALTIVPRTRSAP